MQLPTLRDPAPACRLCVLGANPTLRNPGVPSEILNPTDPLPPSAPAVVFVGMNPGNLEDLHNRPFIGPSGHRLRGVMTPKGWLPGPYVDGPGFRSRARIYLLNAARCATPDDAPRATHYRTCWAAHSHHDLLSISTAHPRTVVICLGAGPATLLFSQAIGRTTSLNASFAHPATPHPTYPNTFLFATYHPAFLLRKPPMRYAVADHLSLVVDFLDDCLPTPTSPTLTLPGPPPLE